MTNRNIKSTLTLPAHAKFESNNSWSKLSSHYISQNIFHGHSICFLDILIWLSRNVTLFTSMIWVATTVTSLTLVRSHLSSQIDWSKVEYETVKSFNLQVILRVKQLLIFDYSMIFELILVSFFFKSIWPHARFLLNTFLCYSSICTWIYL